MSTIPKPPMHSFDSKEELLVYLARLAPERSFIRLKAGVGAIASVVKNNRTKAEHNCNHASFDDEAMDKWFKRRAARLQAGLITALGPELAKHVTIQGSDGAGLWGLELKVGDQSCRLWL